MPQQNTASKQFYPPQSKPQTVPKVYPNWRANEIWNELPDDVKEFMESLGKGYNPFDGLDHDGVIHLMKTATVWGRNAIFRPRNVHIDKPDTFFDSRGNQYHVDTAHTSKGQKIPSHIDFRPASHGGLKFRIAYRHRETIAYTA